MDCFENSNELSFHITGRLLYLLSDYELLFADGVSYARIIHLKIVRVSIPRRTLGRGMLHEWGR